MKAKKILKLADFIAKLKPRKLDMGTVCETRGSEKMDYHKCNSAACAMGWTPAVFPREVRWGGNFKHDEGNIVTRGRVGEYDYDAVIKLFDISYSDARVLFGSGSNNYHTPKQVSKGLREYAKTGIVPDWI